MGCRGGVRFLLDIVLSFWMLWDELGGHRWVLSQFLAGLMGKVLARTSVFWHTCYCVLCIQTAACWGKWQERTCLLVQGSKCLSNVRDQPRLVLRRWIEMQIWANFIFCQTKVVIFLLLREMPKRTKDAKTAVETLVPHDIVKDISILSGASAASTVNTSQEPQIPPLSGSGSTNYLQWGLNMFDWTNLKNSSVSQQQS